MSAETIRDILHWTVQFHDNLYICLQQDAGCHESERCTMMLEYLADQEARLAGVVEHAEQDGNEKALNTWCYEHMEKRAIADGVLPDIPFYGLEIDEIVGELTNQHAQVIDLYRNLSRRVNIPEARELLESIHVFEAQVALQVAQSANRFREL